MTAHPHIHPLLAAGFVLFWTAASAQDGGESEGEVDTEAAAEEVKSKAESVMSDPRLRNVFRSVEDEAREASDSIDAESEEDVVREATRLFREQKEKLESESGDLPVDEEQMKKAGDTARSVVEDAMSSSDGSDDDVPATRSEATRTARPVAQPVGSDPSTTEAENPPPDPNTPPTRETPAGTDGPDTPGAPTPARSRSEPDTPPSNDEAVDMQPDATRVVQDDTVRPAPDTSPTPANVPEAPLFAESDVPEPRALRRKYETDSSGSYQSAGGDAMVISSRESTMDNERGLLTFLGNVKVDHPDFDIDCEKLEIYLTEGAPDDSSQPSTAAFDRAIASGGMVEIRRQVAPEDGGSKKRKNQVALARRAEYDKASGNITLSGGPPYVQDGDRYIKTKSPDARIVMHRNGNCEITGSDAGATGRSTISIPVKKDGSQNLDLGSGLGSSVDQLE